MQRLLLYDFYFILWFALKLQKYKNTKQNWTLKYIFFKYNNKRKTFTFITKTIILASTIRKTTMISITIDNKFNKRRHVQELVRKNISRKWSNDKTRFNKEIIYKIFSPTFCRLECFYFLFSCCSIVKLFCYSDVQSLAIFSPAVVYKISLYSRWPM